MNLQVSRLCDCFAFRGRGLFLSIGYPCFCYGLHSNEIKYLHCFFLFLIVWALRSFKEAVYEDPYQVLSNWDTVESDPCNWFGVLCTMLRDHVIKL